MESILDCVNLVKRYSGKTALNGVHISIPRGRIIGLLGPNGSGKSTLMNLSSGLLTPTSGKIFVAGKEIGPETKKIVSYLPDHLYLNDWMRVSDLISFFADFYSDFDAAKACDMLARLQITPRVQLKTLSKGNKEKVQLILAMSRQAQLYLLDEPIAGVDPAARSYILDTVFQNYNRNATMIISTHLISDIEPFLDDVIFLSNGNILLCNPAEGLRQQYGKSIDEVFREVFRC